MSTFSPPAMSWRDRTGLDRRRFFQLIAAGVSIPSALNSCGIPGLPFIPMEKRAGVDRSSDGTLRWSSWPYYIDIGHKPHSGRAYFPTLERFTAEKHIRVTYDESINDNDVFFGKVRPILTARADPGRDLCVLSDWMVNRLHRVSWIQNFDHSRIPNVRTNHNPIIPQNIFDRDNTFSVPYVYGLISVAYNTRATGGRPVTSMMQLLHDPLLRGKVSLLAEMESTMSLVLLELGYDPENFTPQQFRKGLAEIGKAIAAGQIKSITGNEYTDGLSAGNFAASVAYSGDITQLRDVNSDIHFVELAAGTKFYTDNFVLLNYISHKRNAHSLVNFYYQPDVSAQLYSYIRYTNPVAGAQEIMRRYNPSVVHDRLVFPTPQQAKKFKSFMPLSAEMELTYNRDFQKVIGV